LKQEKKLDQLSGSSDLDYFVGYFMVALPDFVAACVLCGIGILALDPYFDWSEKRIGKLSGRSAWLFLITVILVPWFAFLLLVLYFACHGALVLVSFAPTWIAAADRIRSGAPLFPLRDYSQYTLYFLERESHITLGPTWDSLLKGLTPSGTALQFGGEEMRFSVAEARVREFWGILGRDRFTGAIIRTVLVLVNVIATMGSAWGFFAFLHKAKQHWSRSAGERE
jgi:hypothetical protein